MAKRKLFTQIFPFYLVIILITVITLSWYIAGTLKDFYLTEKSTDLEARSNLVKEYLNSNDLINSSDLKNICIDLAKTSKTRITVIDISGKVLADSEEDPAVMDNHADRLEIRRAYQGQTGASARYSFTLEKEMMYLAVPFINEDKIVSVIRLSLPFTSIEQTLWQAQGRILFGGIIVALLAGAVSFFVSRRITKPLERIKKGAENFANGYFEKKLPSMGTLEIDSLIEMLNQMAKQLDERIRTISRQRNEQEAMLFSMMEGVLAVNNDERILRINKTAADFLQIDVAKCDNKLIHETIRHSALLDFIQKTLRSKDRIETEISILRDEEHFFHVIGTVLQNEDGKQIGALIVMNDVTQFRRLEIMRREFVANVSHELKTPITSIKGFVETMRDKDIEQPEKRMQFLDIVAKQSDRMNAIIDDLLNLSRIEQHEEDMDIQLVSDSVLPVINDAVQENHTKAEKKELTLNVSCGKEVSALINAPLLQQAVSNLIDNAIKYSEREGTIEISGKKIDNEVQISVRDYGCGIDPKYHSRLFERFFRVDKARSRKLGGTGLGLSIVKHIVSLHNGKVSLQSNAGQGSTFTIHLPIS